MKTRPVLILLSLLVTLVHAQDRVPSLRLGESVPSLHLEALLQAPKGSQTNWEALRGKVVVLEFWATWCGPCRVALPHLNELTDLYKHKPVRFISITDEEEWKVRAFLSVNSIAGWIGIDREGSLYKAFGFVSIPQTVLVDRKGRVAALMQPSELTTAVLDSLLAGHPLASPVASPTAPAQVQPAVAPSEAPRLAQDQLESPLVELVFRHAQPSISMSRNRGTFKAKGMALQGLVATAYSTSATRVLAVGPVPGEAYGVTIRVPDTRSELLLPMLQQTMKAALGLRVWKETREIDVLILKMAKEPHVQLRSSSATNSNWMTDDGQISGSAMTMENLRASLEDGISKAVLDETGLKGTYDLALYWNPKDEESVFREVRKQLGLELVKERRPVEILCFTIGDKSSSKAAASTAWPN